jgi:acylphosphatase
LKAQAIFIVNGRVQGVFYRASASEKATSLGLSGWVRNRRNGDVELFARGDPALLDELEAWLWQGPRMARVTSVKREESLEEAPDDAFRIRSTR